MGILNKLKAVLLLDTSKFRRSARGAKKDVRGVGDETLKTTTAGIKGFLGMAGAVAGVGAAAVAALLKIEAMQVGIAKAAADASRIQQDRLGAAAQATNQGFVRDLQDVTRGLTSGQALSQSLRQAGQFALGGAEDASRIAQGAGIVFGEDITPERAEATRIAQTFAGAFGAGGREGKLLLEGLAGTFQIKDPDALGQAFAGVGFAARTSFLTPGDIGEVISRAGGIGLAQQLGAQPLRTIVGLATRFAPSSAGSPRLVAQAAKTIFGLTTEKTPLIKRVLAEAGFDPETLNPIDVATAIGNKLNQDPRFQITLAEEGITKEIITTLQRGFSAVGNEAQSKALEAFDVAEFGNVEALLADKQTDPNIIRTAADFRIQASQLQPAEPGTLAEAGAISRAVTASILDRPGTQQGIDELRREVNRNQIDFFDTDVAFEKQQLERLFVLNRTFPGLDAQLRKISTRKSPGFRGTGGRTTFTSVGQLAAILRRKLSDAKDAANTTRVIGQQADQIDAFENATQEAIAFIRQVETRSELEFPSIQGAAPFAITPTDVERGAAGSAAVAGVDFTEAAGGAIIKADQVIINNPGPGRTQNTETKTD